MSGLMNIGEAARASGVSAKKLAELQAMKATLAHLVHCCHGDDRPDCPISETLADGNGNAVAKVDPVGRVRRGAARSR